MKKLFTLFLFALLAITSAWAENFSQTYSYGDFTGCSLSDYKDMNDEYYLVPASGTSCDAVISGIFVDKTITSDVKVTLNVATYGSGTNPSASTFTLYADDKATTAVTATKGGTLPTNSSTYTNVTYTVAQANASSLTKDLMIRIKKPGKQIRLKSITVEFTYAAETKPLSSLALSGEPTKTEYYTNEAFSTAGLTVTANYTDGTNADVTSQSTFECNPATFTTAGAQTVKVKAKYNDTYSNEGTYNVTVTELPVYTLVTDVSQLAAGDKIVLANQSAGMVLSTTQNKNNRKATSEGVVFAEENNSLTFSSDQVEIITLEAGKTDGTFAFKVTGGYLYAASSSSNNLKTQPTNNANGSAKISIDSSTGVASIVFQGTNTNNVLRYNSTSELFACYGSATQSPVYIYKAASSGKPAAPTFDPVSGTAFDTETATVTITAPEGCTLKYTVGSGEEQTSTTNTATVTVSPTAYTITAKSVDAEDVESNEATASYTFNVVAHVKNIAEFLALPDKTTAIFDNPVVVLYDYSQPSTHQNDAGEYSNPEYIWVKDESGQTNLYLEVAIDPTNHQAKYENGDVIPAGFKAVKNYYIDGKFYQALVDTDNKSLLADASHKRLADPVTITFDEFNALQVGSDADIAKWNNTYVMISKVTMAADETDKRGKTYNVSHNGVAATNNVFYNKYSDLRDGKYALTKQGEDARVTMPTSSTIEYNVYGILQRFNEYWEIMPIRFVEYSEATVTLKELVEAGNAGTTTEGTEYTILNDLRGVVALPNNVILAKDENGNAVGKVTPAGKSFVITAKSYFSDDTTESVNAKAQEDYDQSNWVEIVLPTGVSASDYVDKIITGLSVKGQYKNTLNPRLEASVAPTPGGETGAYTRNAMCPANFMGTSQACNSEEHHGDYFFMTPKPNECVQVVWAVYNSTDGNFYIPAKEGSINTHAFKGGFDIDWTYNAGGVIDGLQDGGLYQFKAVVKKQEKAEPQSGKRRIDYYNTELSTDYLVYPLNLDGNYVTGITEAAGAKTVKSVRYFNIMGVELAEPAAGVNIVLTTYTDGTTHSQKILK